MLARTTSKASTSYNSSDASYSVSSKKLKLNASNRDATENETHFNSNEANICKNIQDNSQMEESDNDSMNGESISNFDRSRFYEEKDSSYYIFTYRFSYFRKYK